MKALIMLALLPGLAATARADTAHDAAWLVNAAIYYNQTLIATPALKVLPGKEAGIQASCSERDAYRLTLTLTPIDNGSKLNIAARLQLAGKDLTFAMRLKPGQAGAIKTGATALDLMAQKSGNGPPQIQ